MIAALVSAAKAQDTNPLILTADAHYYDFWEETWYVLRDDNTLDSSSFFKVSRSVNAASFTEE